MVLNVHLTEAAIAGVGGNVARCGNTRTPVLLDQVRDWCQSAGSDHRRPDQGPRRPPPRRGLRDPRPDQAADRAAQPHLRLPPLHPPRGVLRPRPHRPPRSGRHRRSDLLPQHRPTLQTTPPRQDPRPLALPPHPPHRLRVDHAPRLPHRPRPPRHPPRDPARPPARPRALTTQPRAPAYPHHAGATGTPGPTDRNPAAARRVPAPTVWSPTAARTPESLRFGPKPTTRGRLYCGLVPNRRPPGDHHANRSPTVRARRDGGRGPRARVGARRDRGRQLSCPTR